MAKTKTAAARKANHEKRGTSDEDKETGRRIRLFRTERGLSQSELGAKLQVSFQQIQKYENGGNRVSCGRLMQIARILSTTPHELMGWNDKTPTIAIDPDTYRLAKAFAGLNDTLKRPIRLLISSLMEMKL